MQRTFRFKDQAAKDAHNKNIPNDKTEVFNEIDANIGSALACFTQIEEGLSRIIYTALVSNPDAQNNIWREQCLEIRNLFGMSHMARMVNHLVRLGALRLNIETIPRFGKTPTETIGFLEAIDLAAKYRNALAHEGFVYGVSLTPDNKLEYHGLIAPGGLPVGIVSQSSVIRKNEDGSHHVMYEGFMDFIGRIASGLPLYFITPAFLKGETVVDPKTFL